MAKTITGVDYEGGKVVGITISGIIDADNDQPTSAYFQRVRHGRWNDGDPYCPICRKDKFRGLDADVWADWKPDYCPNCGAKMDGGTN